MPTVYLTQNNTRNNHAASVFLFDIGVLYSSRVSRKIGPSKVKSQQVKSQQDALTLTVTCRRKINWATDEASSASLYNGFTVCRPTSSTALPTPPLIFGSIPRNYNLIFTYFRQTKFRSTKSSCVPTTFLIN